MDENQDLFGSKKPSDYGLNHDEWRPGQQELIDWGYSQMDADSASVGIAAAPTGTGKTTLPKALSAKYRTVALVRTKSLQSDNYERGYGFQPLYGRSNYDCIHEDAADYAKSDDCIFAEQGMINCQHGKAAMQKIWPDKEYDDLPVGHFSEKFDGCPYVLAREKAKIAKRAVLNYAYWFHTYEKWPSPQAIVCDEGHQLSDLTLEWAGCTISEDNRLKWELKPFPMIRGGADGMLTKLAPATERATGWLEQSLVKLHEIHTRLSIAAKNDEKARKQSRQVELLGKKLNATLEALRSTPEDWYIKSGPGVQNNRPAFVARPLTAKNHFKRYFMTQPWKLFIMSATIGNPQVFADELGLADYSHYEVPSLYAATQRPVVALDVPSMGQACGDKGRNKQADEIANAIKDCPSNWSGIIHVTAMNDASQIAERLARRGLQDRVWVSPRGLGTDGMVNAWQERMRKVPGSLNISWAFWEGYDGKQEKISIVAKIPFPYLGDEYEVARRNHNTRFYLQRAAWQAEQGCGRSRRGRIEDYDTSEEKNGLVCIADGSYKTIKSYFSESFRESIVKNG